MKDLLRSAKELDPQRPWPRPSPLPAECPFGVLDTAVRNDVATRSSPTQAPIDGLRAPEARAGKIQLLQGSPKPGLGGHDVDKPGLRHASRCLSGDMARSFRTGSRSVRSSEFVGMSPADPRLLGMNRNAAFESGHTELVTKPRAQAQRRSPGRSPLSSRRCAVH